MATLEAAKVLYFGEGGGTPAYTTFCFLWGAEAEAEGEEPWKVWWCEGEGVRGAGDNGEDLSEGGGGACGFSKLTVRPQGNVEPEAKPKTSLRSSRHLEQEETSLERDFKKSGPFSVEKAAGICVPPPAPKRQNDLGSSQDVVHWGGSLSVEQWLHKNETT